MRLPEWNMAVLRERQSTPLTRFDLLVPPRLSRFMSMLSASVTRLTGRGHIASRNSKLRNAVDLRLEMKYQGFFSPENVDASRVLKQ